MYPAHAPLPPPAQVWHWELKKYETGEFPFIMQGQFGFIDLTNCALLLEIRETPEYAPPLISKLITTETDEATVGIIDEPTQGLGRFRILEADTAPLTVGRTYFMTAWYIPNRDLPDDGRMVISADSHSPCVATFRVNNP
ncbi:hypothetical protein FACS1894186_4980 [Alphaproteobacteria bacterium]|nr:hypothetical protein FACS1894186_4980 [Alphaproteobacteria bacterium]